jgi:protease-4
MQFTRESIFLGTIRSFLNGFAIFLGILVALSVGAIVFFSMSEPDLYPPAAHATIAPDAKGSRRLLAASSPVILRIDIHGTIGDVYLTSSDFENLLLDSREELLQNNRVKGILLHIDTPGGTESDVSTIHRLILDYKAKYNVPVFAYIDGICASGGIYVACACDKIFATPWSIIGSVGVLFPPHFNFSEAMERWGIQSVTLTEGKDKDMLNPFRPWAPNESSSLQPILANLYSQFVDVVTTARPRLDKQKLIDVYGAQVFVADTALEYGYIDSTTTTYSDTLKALAVAAGLKEDESYQVIQLAAPHSLLVDLFKARSTFFQGKIVHTLQTHPSLPPELCGQPLYLYLPQ